MESLKIAIIDDDLVFASTLSELIEDHEVEYFTTSYDGIEALLNNKYDILVLDYFIDELNGNDVVERIRHENPELYILVLTGYSQKMPAMDALRLFDIQDYCEKSARSFETIKIRIESAVKSVMQINNIKSLHTINCFAKRLKYLRESYGELQMDLADFLGVSRQAIGSYESGRSEPGYDVLKQISKHYRVSIDYLLGNIV